MDPAKWGPSAWALFHRLASNKIPHSIQAYKEFFLSLRYVLPCCICRDNYSGHLSALEKEFPEDVKDLPAFIIKLHNRVNKMKAKPVHDGIYDGKDDIWIFLNAIVSTHVYSKTHGEDPKEVKALTTFWKFLCPVLDTRELDVTNRKKMEKWVRKLHKAYCLGK